MPEPEQPQPQPDPKRHPDLELQLPLLREEWRARELLELEPQEPLQELQPARVPRQPVQLDRDDLPVEVQPPQPLHELDVPPQEPAPVREHPQQLGLMGLPLTARFPVGKPVVPAALTWS